jgi:hypothetical protein
MSCAICGKPTLIGARLCSPCRAALKRAKDDTVFELPPALAEAAARRHASAAAAAEEATPAAPARRSRRVRTLALGVVCAAAFGATALHLAAQGDERGMALQVADAVPQAWRMMGNAPTGIDPTNGQSSAPAALPVTAVPAATALPVLAAGPDVSGPAHADAGGASSTLPDRPPSLHKRLYDTLVRAPREPLHAPRPVTPPAEGDLVTTLPTPAAAPPAPVNVAVAAPAPAVRADPWQGLDHALALCAGETLFARLACEHRARARFCEGRWGDPTHCPSAVNVDHGQ